MNKAPKKNGGNVVYGGNLFKNILKGGTELIMKMEFHKQQLKLFIFNISLNLKGVIIYKM